MCNLAGITDDSIWNGGQGRMEKRRGDGSEVREGEEGTEGSLRNSERYKLSTRSPTLFSLGGVERYIKCLSLFLSHSLSLFLLSLSVSLANCFVSIYSVCLCVNVCAICVSGMCI